MRVDIVFNVEGQLCDHTPLIRPYSVEDVNICAMIRPISICAARKLWPVTNDCSLPGRSPWESWNFIFQWIKAFRIKRVTHFDVARNSSWDSMRCGSGWCIEPQRALPRSRATLLRPLNTVRSSSARPVALELAHATQAGLDCPDCLHQWGSGRLGWNSDLLGTAWRHVAATEDLRRTANLRLHFACCSSSLLCASWWRIPPGHARFWRVCATNWGPYNAWYSLPPCTHKASRCYGYGFDALRGLTRCWMPSDSPDARMDKVSHPCENGDASWGSPSESTPCSSLQTARRILHVFHLAFTLFNRNIRFSNS